MSRGVLVIHCAQGRIDAVGRGPWLFIVPRVGTIQFDGALVINYVQGGDNTVGRAIVVMGKLLLGKSRATQSCPILFHFHGNF